MLIAYKLNIIITLPAEFCILSGLKKKKKKKLNLSCVQ